MRSQGDITRRGLLALAAVASLVFGGCVDQHPERSAARQAAEDAVASGSRAEGDAAAGALASGASDGAAIVATSPAVVDICNKLDLDLVGVPKTSSDLPDRYEGVEVVGTPMAPDMELIAALHPDYVLSPGSLREDLEPKYEAAGLGYYFLDLSSLDGMYSSIEQIGEAFDREEQAEDLVDGYARYLRKLEREVGGREAPDVLLLMGVPGSYLVATENSYAGSLVKQAGGVNVYEGTGEDFLNANVEDMLARDPDIILRCVHGVPADVVKMFAEEFATNDIWQHFRAVRDGQVFDLPYDLFGMSATFDYPEAFDELRGYLYGQGA